MTNPKNEPHAFKLDRSYAVGRYCRICERQEGNPVHIATLPGMEGSDAQREEARQLQQAEELTARLLEARPSIDAQAGRMERESPLFFGQGENPILF